MNKERRLYQRDINILMKKEIVSIVNNKISISSSRVGSLIALKYGVSKKAVLRLIDMLVEVEILEEKGGTLTMCVQEEQ